MSYKRLQELSAELEERKKNQEKDGFETEQDSISKLDEIFSVKEDLFVEISTTTSIESSKPLFFVPPLEPDFVMMKKITRYITRPIIGIHWLDEFDDKTSIKEIANIIAKSLIAKFGNCEFDLVGYSFGAVLVLEIAIQLQQKTSATVRKIIMLDGSYQYLKSRGDDMVNKLEFNEENKEKILNLILIRFAEYVIKLEGIESLEDQLLKLPDLNAKAEKVVSMIKNKFNHDLNTENLMKVIRSIYNKLNMINSAEPKDKFKGDILLIRTNEHKSSLIANTVTESYGVEKFCTGKTEIIKMNGDHHNFLASNAKDIGHLIDVSTAYLSI